MRGATITAAWGLFVAALEEQDEEGVFAGEVRQSSSLPAVESGVTTAAADPRADPPTPVLVPVPVLPPRSAAERDMANFFLTVASSTPPADEGEEEVPRAPPPAAPAAGGTRTALVAEETAGDFPPPPEAAARGFPAEPALGRGCCCCCSSVLGVSVLGAPPAREPAAAAVAAAPPFEVVAVAARRATGVGELFLLFFLPAGVETPRAPFAAAAARELSLATPALLAPPPAFLEAEVGVVVGLGDDAPDWELMLPLLAGGADQPAGSGCRRKEQVDEDGALKPSSWRVSPGYRKDC